MCSRGPREDFLHVKISNASTGPRRSSRLCRSTLRSGCASASVKRKGNGKPKAFRNVLRRSRVSSETDGRIQSGVKPPHSKWTCTGSRAPWITFPAPRINDCTRNGGQGCPRSAGKDACAPAMSGLRYLCNLRNLRIESYSLTTWRGSLS